MQQVLEETMPSLRGIVFTDATSTAVTTAAVLREQLDNTDAFAFVELADPSHDQLAELSRAVGDPELLRHPAPASGHAAVTQVDTHVMLSARRLELDIPTLQLSVSDLRVYVLPRALIVDHDGSFDTTELVRRFGAAAKHRSEGVGYLLWVLIDELLAEMNRALEALDSELDDVEDGLLAPAAKPVPVQARVYQLRKSTAGLRRCILPLRDGVDALLRREAACISPALYPLFQGLYDRAVHLAEWADSIRDLVTALSDTQISMEGNRLNVIMKKVTSWAAILAVPAAVTGFYGQNVPFPGVNSMGGFWTSAVVMAGGGIALYATFKKKDWL